MNDPLGVPGSTPFYLCLLPVRSCAGGECYFPTAHEMNIKRKPFSAGTLLYRNICSVLLSTALAVLESNSRELAFLANLGKLSTI